MYQLIPPALSVWGGKFECLDCCLFFRTQLISEPSSVSEGARALVGKVPRLEHIIQIIYRSSVPIVHDLDTLGRVDVSLT